MKKDMTIKLAVILFVGVLFTACAVSNTFAKYVSEANGNDSARVAKWAVKVGETDITQTDTFAIDLFKDTYIDGSTTYVDGNGDNVVAPGTKGEFSLAVKNESEVLVNYNIDYTITNNDNIPIKFSVDNGATWLNTIQDITSDTRVDIDSTETINVKWKWDETSTDAADTALGIPGTATIVVNAKVTASQVVMP